MSKNYVFDSFAILTFLRAEKGAQTVEKHLMKIQTEKDSEYISAANLAEIYYIIWREKNKNGAEIAIQSIKDWGIEIVPLTEELAKIAGKLKAEHTLSLADAFAAATTEQIKGSLLTGDPEFKSLKSLIPIVWVQKNLSE